MLCRPHTWPEESKFGVVGEQFAVNFYHVYHNLKKLVAARLWYKVRHKGQLKGARERSSIWRYRVKMEYLEDIATTTKL